MSVKLALAIAAIHHNLLVEFDGDMRVERVVTAGAF
jgi:hypothetical protein